MLEGRNVFLAAPYQAWMDPEKQQVDETKRQHLEGLRGALMDRGSTVFSAHFNEQWGKGWLPPDVCTPADFEGVRAADVILAIVGRPQSGGVAVEVGWASALQKPILVLFDDDGAAASPLFHGIGEITPAEVLTRCRWWEPDAVGDICNRLEELIARSVPARPAPLDGRSAGFVGTVPLTR